jgi:HEPN domain-containing protein
MKNKSLTLDYIGRAQIRIGAIEYLYSKKSWADVVRESQAAVELALKSLLRFCNIDVPRIHDVSGIIMQEKDKMPVVLNKDLEKLCEISHRLRRDRELAYYGSEDLTPSEFYQEKDAKEALDSARFVVETLAKVIKE